MHQHRLGENGKRGTMLDQDVLAIPSCCRDDFPILPHRYSRFTWRISRLNVNALESGFFVILWRKEG
jgi:hypothetical protein